VTDRTSSPSLPPAPSSATSAGSWVFERIEEYKAVLDNLVQLSARRQNTNNVFVGLNTIFLTGLGILLLSTRFTSWWIAGAALALTLAITPLNLTWRVAIIRYKRGINVRKEYLQEIEQEFRQRRAQTAQGPVGLEGKEGVEGTAAGAPPLGLFLKVRETTLHRHGNTELELRLVTYFLVLYPLITLVVGILTYLVSSRVIPASSTH
jgi:hypothetical protein